MTTITVEEKACSKCGETKPLDAYHRDGTGRRSECKECSKAANRQKYLRNREKVLARQASYYRANADKVKEYVKEWRQANPDKCRKYHLEYAQRNPEKEAERHRLKQLRDRAKNPEKYAERHRKWAQANPEKVRAKTHRRRVRKRKNGEFLILDREYQKLYASPCALCGTTENITADHIIPLVRGGRHSIGNLQPLCLRCNCRKNDRFMAEFNTSGFNGRITHRKGQGEVPLAPMCF